VSYRGRIAPTPTGLLHRGHAATFWTAFQRARDARGTVVLRVEDLDPHRCKKEFADAAIEDLRWLGIDWDEGPDVGGPHAPYVQSERREYFLSAWKRLRDAGLIYPCSKSRRDVAEAALAPHDDEPVFPIEWRVSSEDGLKWNEPKGINWRFRVPDGETISFHDLNLGIVEKVAGRDFGDFLVWNRDDVPAYELAVVVDDIAMEITEVVRGADLLTSTARQILLYRAFGVTAPGFFHCPLIIDEHGRRLAKRNDALSIRALREFGASPKEVREAPLCSGGL
jgi:glutamyl-tRNA synthetase